MSNLMCLEIEQRDDLLAILGNLRQRYERVAAEQPRLSDVLERFGGTGLIQAVVVSDLGGRSETREHYYGLLGYEPAGQVEWHVDKWDPEGNRLAILEAIDISSGLGHRFDMLFEHEHRVFRRQNGQLILFARSDFWQPGPLTRVAEPYLLDRDTPATFT